MEDVGAPSGAMGRTVILIVPTLERGPMKFRGEVVRLKAHLPELVQGL